MAMVQRKMDILDEFLNTLHMCKSFIRFQFLFVFILMVFGLVESSRAQVTLLFPDDKEELTDIAVSFKAKITSDGPHYLYVSKNSDFTGAVIRRPTEPGHQGEIQYNHYYFLTHQGKVTPSTRFVLTPGTWYWRVSGDGGNTFSETRTLYVNDLKPLTPPEWNVSPEKPMFHMRLRSDLADHAPNGDIAGQLKKIIPDHLKEYVVLDLGHSFHWLPDERSLYEYSKIFDDLGYKYFYDMGSHSWLGRIASLGEMEKVFRDLKHCVGASTPEIFYYVYAQEGDRSMMDGALELCRKYGKKFLMADMNWKWSAWQRFNYLYYDTFMERQYADYYIPQVKTTDPWGAYTNVSAIQGMKLTGMVKDIGVWSDWWSWGNAGQVNTTKFGKHGEDNHKLYPFIQNIKQYIYGITYGSTTFGLEFNLQWHWRTVEPNDHYHRYLEPFISAVVEENLIPSEDVLNKNFNVLVDTEYSSGAFGASEPLTFRKGNIWGDFLRSTYGISDLPLYQQTNTAGGVSIINAAYLEVIPNSDRYPSGIPFLPNPNVSAPTLNGKTMDIVKISDLDDYEKVNENLNKFYPESTNEAYANKIDQSIFVFNTWENNDIHQSYKVGIHHAGIDSLMGDIDLLSYVVGRLRADGKTVFFQTNAYVPNPDLTGGKYELPHYPTIMKFKCQVAPIVESDEMEAIVKNEWDDMTKTLTLEIDHTLAGAVNFTLSGDASISYEAEDIEFDKEEAQIDKGQTIGLTGRILPSTVQGISLTWRSINPNIASVTRDGILTGINAGTTQVIAKIGEITKTMDVTVINRVVSVDENNETRLNLYPNPVTAGNTLQIELPKRSLIKIYDAYGNAIFNSENSNKLHKVGTNGWLPGLYLISVDYNSKIISQKIIIN